MNDNIDKNEIRKAIDRLQAEHPCGIVYDPTVFVNMEAVNTIKECVDKIARRMMEDTEINIICEFAKLYLDGVRPAIERPHGEWIKVEFRTQEEKLFYGDAYRCSRCKVISDTHGSAPYCENCGASMVKEAGDPDA